MVPRSAVAVVFAVAMTFGCTRRGAVRPAADTQHAADDQQAAITALEGRAHRLAAEWDDVAAGNSRAADAFRLASERFELARRDLAIASSEYQSAEREWKSAQQSWAFYQRLVVIAAAIDASNMNGARSDDAPDCTEGMSTQTYRALLGSQGVDLTGKDIDHIVPRSLGGADHPWNYQVIDSSLNRSLGAQWDAAKCAMPGTERCAGAVAASRRCGTFAGPLPF